MNDEIYTIAKTLDSCLFVCGLVATAVLGVKVKLNGIERYKFIIKLATAFLSILAIINVYITVHKYEIIAQESGISSEYADYLPAMAGAICFIVFAVIIGILWLIYAIWNKKRQKK